MTGEQIIAMAIAKRKTQGLELRFSVPDRDTPFTCYAKDEAQKAQWLANAAKRGWRLL